MAGLPDPSGGIGYANVFGENRAIDDWRDDWKYKQALKTKKAEQQAKLKLDIPFLDGWASKDSPELNQLYNGLANRGATLLAAGTDPMTNPQFLGQTQKAKLLAAAGKEHEATFNQGVTELDALLKTGDITPDQYREAKGNWMDYANAGITDDDMAKGKVGRIAARMQMTPPSNPMPFNADEFANKQISVLDAAAKVKTPTLNPDGTVSTDERVPKATIEKQVDYNNAFAKQHGVPQEQMDITNNKLRNSFGYAQTRTVPREGSDIGSGTTRAGLIAVPSFEDLSNVNLEKSSKMVQGVVDRLKADKDVTPETVKHVEDSWGKEIADVQKRLGSKRTRAIDFRVEGKNPPANNITLKRGMVFSDSESAYTQNPDEYVSMTFTPTKLVDLGNGDFLATGKVKGASDDVTSEDSKGVKTTDATTADTNEGTIKTKSTTESKSGAKSKSVEGGNVTILLKKGSPEKKNFENVYLTDDDIETWMKQKGDVYKKLGSDTWNKNENQDKTFTASTPNNDSPQLPAIGTVVKGYKFIGGNPSKPENWQKQ